MFLDNSGNLRNSPKSFSCIDQSQAPRRCEKHRFPDVRGNAGSHQQESFKVTRKQQEKPQINILRSTVSCLSSCLSAISARNSSLSPLQVVCSRKFYRISTAAVYASEKSWKPFCWIILALVLKATACTIGASSYKGCTSAGKCIISMPKH